jgi:tetratricopeptide (TPR) repeat protein
MSVVEQPKKKISLPEYFQKGYILVVDDIPNMRKTIKNMLRQCGVNNTIEAEDGDHALKILRKDQGASGHCLFVLLDWNMPKMPGIFVTREIRADANLGDLPILMITAEVNREQITQAGELGVSGYVIKPFVANTLQEKIVNVLMARENPPEFVKLLKAGEILASRGQFDKALALYNEALTRQNGARVMVQIGHLHEQMGEDDKALTMFNKAAESNPMFLKAHVKAAEIHVRKGDEDAALVSLQKANDISPSSPDRHLTMGKIHLKKGDEEKAVEHFNTVMKQAPERAQDVAEELLSSGKPERAEQVFRKTLLKDGDNIHIYNRLGIALRRQGKWKESIKEYEKALKIDPANEALYFNMAKAYVEGKDADSARKFFKRVLQLNPDLEEARKEIEALDQ